MRIPVIVFMSAAAFAAAGCVGDRAELGGVDNRLTPPASTRACNLDEMRIVDRGKYVVPDEVGLFYYATQIDPTTLRMIVLFDVTEMGTTANIRYAGPASDMRHATRQKLIRAAAEAIAATRYEWIGAPVFAVSCKRSVRFLINQNQREAD